MKIEDIKYKMGRMKGKMYQAPANKLDVLRATLAAIVITSVANWGALLAIGILWLTIEVIDIR